MNVFRGLAIMLLTIIAYMIIDSLINIPLLTIMLCAAAGTLIVFTCKGMNKEELNMFRASLIMGIVFFFIGNYIIFSERTKVYYDLTAITTMTFGFFFAAIGMIVMFSSIPIIVYKDLQEHLRRKNASGNIGYGGIQTPPV